MYCLQDTLCKLVAKPLAFALPVQSITPSSSTHLTVPGQQTAMSPSALSPPSSEIINKDSQCNEIELLSSEPRGVNIRYLSAVRKPSNTLSIRQQPRLSDVSVHPRKVSFCMYRL